MKELKELYELQKEHIKVLTQEDTIKIYMDNLNNKII